MCIYLCKDATDIWPHNPAYFYIPVQSKPDMAAGYLRNTHLGLLKPDKRDLITTGMHEWGFFHFRK